MEFKVRSEECQMCSKCRLWWSVLCVECVECGVWSVGCKVRSVECKVWSVQWVKCRV